MTKEEATDLTVTRVIAADGKVVASAKLSADVLNSTAPPALPECLRQLVEAIPPEVPKDGLKIEVSRVVRFWMDAQGMRARNEIVTVVDDIGIPRDTVYGLPLEVCDSDAGREAARAAERAHWQRRGK